MGTWVYIVYALRSTLSFNTGNCQLKNDIEVACELEQILYNYYIEGTHCWLCCSRCEVT